MQSISQRPEIICAQRVFACERCSRRKQRCDRNLPVCAPCQASGSQCADSDKEKGIVQLNDREVMRKGYVTTLIERIATLEEEARQKGISVDVPVPGIYAETTAGTTTPDRPGHGSPKSSSNDAGQAAALSSLSLSAMAEPRSRAGEFLKQLSMPRIIAGVTETYGGNPEATARVDSLWDGISKYIRHPAGPSHRLHIHHAEARKALDTYIDVVDFRFPRLPVAKIQAGMDAITAAEDGMYRETLSKDPSHIFMAYMVIAIVPLVSDNYPISQGSFVSIHLLGKCLKVLDRVFRQEDGVDIIQCLHLLVIFSIHCSAAGSAWHLVGFAMNKCIALGYHREVPRSASAGLTPEDLQQRRWAFWGCYLLDRLLCAALGRPFSIDDRDITVSLPDEALTIPLSLSANEHFHAHLFRYAILLSSATREDSSRSFDFNYYLGHLLHWRTSTPAPDHLSLKQAYLYQTSLFNTLMLRLAIQHVLNAHDPEVGVQAVDLISICRAVARSIDRTRMIGRHFLSLVTGYSAFSMGLATLLCCVVDAPPYAAGQREQQQQGLQYHTWDDLLDVACQKLDVVGRQFPRLHEYRLIIERVRRMLHGKGETQEAVNEVEGLVASIGPVHLRQLAEVVLRSHLHRVDRERPCSGP
ncbi:hypothetical protein ACHAQA_007711 [Verticillium albo-atrum]